jgi:dihydroxyacid dehydratase/phosphogluconate dehydratase
VRTGDEIEIDIPARRLTLHVGDTELARRRAAWKQPPPRYTRGYGAIFTQNVTQANEGCDFAVLSSRNPVAEPDIF